MYITTRKIDSQWEFAVSHRELNAGALWQSWGLGVGREVQQTEDICISMTDW